MEQQWIKVLDKLPPLEEEVLLFDHWEAQGKVERKDIRVGYLSSFTVSKRIDGVAHECEWRGTEFAFNITHWMPLPEPPKE